MSSKKSTDKLKQTEEIKENSKKSSLANYINNKASAADVYSIKSRLVPRIATDRIGPKLTARDISVAKKSPLTKTTTRNSEDSIRSNLPSNSSKYSIKHTVTNVKKRTSSVTTLDSSDETIQIHRNTPETSKLKTTKSEVSKINAKEINIKNVSSLSKIKPSTSRQRSSTNISTKQTNSDVKKSAKSTLAKDLPFVGVIVNSPPSRRKVIDDKMNNLRRESSITRLEREKKTKTLTKEAHTERERSKTRTLDYTEIKVINKEVDNNIEMQNLNKKLTEKPTDFFIDLNDNQNKESDYSYEDDFDSYESDFESYKSETTGYIESEGTKSQISEESNESNDLSPVDEVQHTVISSEESERGESSNYEKGLDSGNFDLYEVRRTTYKGKQTMKNIEESEEREEKKNSSLNDEGFQDMSGSSALSITKVAENVDNADRSSFINFTASKENKRLRILREKQTKRAKDLLSMISLHKISYNLYDMKPIPYDKFMTLYGKDNSNQAATQTFDDGENVEVQTDYIEKENKWTQHPVDFSNNDIIAEDCKIKSNVFSPFCFLHSDKVDEDNNNEEYKNNKLKIYLEQKNGVGDGKPLSYRSYEKIISKCDYNVKRLNKFLVKVENNIIKIVSKTKTEILTQKSEWPFSESYTKVIENNKPKFLENTVVSNVAFSETKYNLILTIHNSTSDVRSRKCILCLWDRSVASEENGREPVKVLVAVDNVAMCRYLGDERGIVAAALDDGCVHLWDLSEPSSFHEETTPLEQQASKTNSSEERSTIRSCAYTTSGLVLGETSISTYGDLVGLQLALQHQGELRSEEISLGQICTLYEYGKLILWRIIKDKQNKNYPKIDPGIAYWSKIRLKINQIIDVINFIDSNLNTDLQFNLDASKKRTSIKRKRNDGKTAQYKRPLSSKSIDYEFLDDIDSCSVASAEIASESANWDSGVVCTDLKISCVKECEKYFIARNCGQVICCEKKNGNTKVTRYMVTDSATTIRCVEPLVSRQLVLAGGDAGRAWLLSLQGRVLLTLSLTQHAAAAPQVVGLHWSARAPCRVLARARSALCCWDLARSDLVPAASVPVTLKNSALHSETGELAVVTSAGEVQIHKMKLDESGICQDKLFSSYLALL